MAILPTDKSAHKGTLPPDPGKLRTAREIQGTLSSREGDISAALGMQSEASDRLGGISSTDFSDDAVFARTQAEGAKYYAGTRLDEAQGGQRSFKDEQVYIIQTNEADRFVVTQHNDQVVRTDADGDGKSDYVEHQEAANNQLWRLGAGVVGAMMMTGAISDSLAGITQPGVPINSGTETTGLLTSLFSRTAAINPDAKVTEFATSPTTIGNSRMAALQEIGDELGVKLDSNLILSPPTSINPTTVDVTADVATAPALAAMAMPKYTPDSMQVAPKPAPPQGWRIPGGGMGA